MGEPLCPIFVSVRTDYWVNMLGQERKRTDMLGTIFMTVAGIFALMFIFAVLRVRRIMREKGISLEDLSEKRHVMGFNMKLAKQARLEVRKSLIGKAGSNDALFAVKTEEKTSVSHDVNPWEKA